MDARIWPNHILNAPLFCHAITDNCCSCCLPAKLTLSAHFMFYYFFLQHSKCGIIYSRTTGITGFTDNSKNIHRSLVSQNAHHSLCIYIKHSRMKKRTSSSKLKSKVILLLSLKRCWWSLWQKSKST